MAFAVLPDRCAPHSGVAMAIRDISLGRDHADFLRDTPLLSALDPFTLARLAARLQLVRLDDGDEIVRHGEPGDALYVVSQGRFGVFAGEKRLRTCRRGEIIGEIALLTGGPRTARPKL